MRKILLLLLVIICICTGVIVVANGQSSQSTCTHDKYEYTPEERIPLSIDPETHAWYSIRYVYCSTCKEMLYEEDSFLYLEDHHFTDEGYCDKCGCIKNCKHPNAHFELSQQMPSFFINPELHALEEHNMYYCPDCGEIYWDITPGTAIYEKHDFNEYGICTVCGYNKNTGEFSSPQTETDPVSAKGTITIGGRIITPIKLDIKFLSSADSRHESFSGPGKGYESTGGFKPMKIWSTYAWFIEGDYVLTDVSYQTVKRCTVYLKKSAFESLNGVPEIDLNQVAQPATLTESTVPSMFPRNNRRVFDEKVARLSAGTSITVFFEKDGWYYCEFTSKNNKPARGWIKKELVALTNGH